MNLLLITGAGASRELAYEGETMPLMTDWSLALVDALNGEATDLAPACGLDPDADGPTFETALGDLLHWRQAQPLARKFLGLTASQANSHVVHVEEALKYTDHWLDTVMMILNRTLFDLFGQKKIDEERAFSAYDWLLGYLGSPDLVVATTNYDRSAEAALDARNHEVTTGFHALGQRTPVFRPRGLIASAPDVTPVLHLHGAVGWYATGANVEDHYADKPFNTAFGSPVVLYPDPEKDPTTEVFMADLWEEFRASVLNWADRILVLGHSLNDPPVVRVLQEAIGFAAAEVGVTYLTPADEKQISNLFKDDVSPIHMKFGPDPEWDDAALAKWAS